jgi:hypothetical protein
MPYPDAPRILIRRKEVERLTTLSPAVPASQ